MTTLPDTVSAWITTQADAFRRYEHLPVYTGRQPRDDALIRSVLDALADGACSHTAAIREWVDMRVAGMEEAA